jgi:hypothetical protein
LLVDASGRLLEGFSKVAHCFPPFYDESGGVDGGGSQSFELLAECYVNVLRSCLECSDLGNGRKAEIVVFFPLLGAGCRGFPTSEAVRAAARGTALCEAILRGRKLDDGLAPSTVAFRFGCLENKTLEELETTLQA